MDHEWNRSSNFFDKLITEFLPSIFLSEALFGHPVLIDFHCIFLCWSRLIENMGITVQFMWEYSEKEIGLARLGARSETALARPDLVQFCISRFGLTRLSVCKAPYKDQKQIPKFSEVIMSVIIVWWEYYTTV